MGQLRTMKIGLEARLGCKINSDWAILQWMSELAPELMNRGQVGREGRTVYYRLHGKDSKKGMLEFAEQIMAKPMRAKKPNKKLSLKKTLGFRNLGWPRPQNKQRFINFVKGWGLQFE